MGATITLEPDLDGRVRTAVLDGLRAFNRLHAPPPGFETLVLAARDDGHVIGGLIGESGWQWLHVDLLWIAEPYRGSGLGSRLLREAEQEALRRGATRAYLDTFDFQARTFYEHHGYVHFGVQEDYPPGHTRYFMRRDLRGSEP